MVPQYYKIYYLLSITNNSAWEVLWPHKFIEFLATRKKCTLIALVFAFLATRWQLTTHNEQVLKARISGAEDLGKAFGWNPW